jgi:hypothetical protein
MRECMAALGGNPHTVSKTMNNLLRRGFLWRAGIGIDQRYFASEANRDAWAAVELPKMAAARLEAKRAKWRSDERRQHDKLRALGLMPPRKELPPMSRAELVEMASRKKGASRHEMAAKFGRSDNGMSNHLYKMVRDGLLHRAGPKTHGARYFADLEHAQAYSRLCAEKVIARPKASNANRYAVAPPKASTPANVTIKARRAWDNAEPVIPPGVTVQVVPGYRGHPLLNVEVPRGQGVISQDWKNTRLMEVQHG